MFLHEIPRATFSALEKTNWIVLKLFLFHCFKSPLDIRPCNNPIATGWYEILAVRNIEPVNASANPELKVTEYCIFLVKMFSLRIFYVEIIQIQNF